MEDHTLLGYLPSAASSAILLTMINIMGERTGETYHSGKTLQKVLPINECITEIEGLRPVGKLSVICTSRISIS